MSGRPRARVRRAADGFTLVEVLVALVIVAFGMGAVLAALSSSASNVAALREKTLAQWVALNLITDVRLSLQPPQTGTSEGDVKGFGNADWHWQQIISNVQEIPGLLQVTVKVRRTATNTGSSGGAGSTGSSISTTRGGSSIGKEQDWTATVIGFRGTSVAAASGEVPDWSGAAAGGTAASGSSSGGTIANPGSSSSASSSGAGGTGGSSLGGSGLGSPGLGGSSGTGLGGSSGSSLGGN